MLCNLCSQRQQCIPWQMAHHDLQVKMMLQQMEHCEIGGRPVRLQRWLRSRLQIGQRWGQALIAKLRTA